MGVIWIVLSVALFAVATVFSRRPSGMQLKHRKLATILCAVAGGLALLAGLLDILGP